MIGTLLSGRFRLDEKLGSGGMSTVYRAFDEVLERWVAIKLLHREMGADPDQLERFRREARAVARLSSPNIVTVIDAGEDDHHPYIVFECVDGETLKDRIRRFGRLPVDEAVAYAIEIGRALSVAHEERLVHRDVKPQNVLISGDGRAKVTDFGIARSLETEGLTQAGRVLGTTDYISPEQALGEDVDEQSDVYSLGIVLFEMLTGDVPFKADNQVGVAMKHVREPLPDVQALRPEVSSALASVVERATAKERANRYRTAAELVHDLEQALAIEAARAGGTSGGEATSVLRTLPGDTSEFAPLRVRNPRRWFALIVAAMALAAAAVTAIVLNAERGQTGSAAPRVSEGLRAVRFAGVEAFDPPPGDGRENSESVRNAIDGNRSTEWTTERYKSETFGNLKDGVGLVLRVRNPVAAQRLDLVSSTPGWDAQGYAAEGLPTSLERWRRVGQVAGVGQTERVRLDTGGAEFRNYLL